MSTPQLEQSFLPRSMNISLSGIFLKVFFATCLVLVVQSEGKEAPFLGSLAKSSSDRRQFLPFLNGVGNYSAFATFRAVSKSNGRAKSAEGEEKDNSSDTENNLSFGRGDKFLKFAYSPSIAVNKHGLVVQAFVRRMPREKKGRLYVRVGQHSFDGIRWAPKKKVHKSKYMDYIDGLDPRVTSIAINNKNFVVLVFARGKGNETDNKKIYYRLGKVDGDEVQWLSPSKQYVSGISPSIALTDEDIVIGVHRAGRGMTSRFLYYIVGKIEEDSIEFGKQHRFQKPEGGDELGEGPAIAAGAASNTVVYVFTDTGGQLKYRVGKLSDDKVDWGDTESQLNDGGVTSSVAVTDDGFVVEVHRSEELKTLWYKTGKIKDGNMHKVHWYNNHAVKFAPGVQPSISIAGSRKHYVLVQTNREYVSGSYSRQRVVTRTTLPITRALIEKDLPFRLEVGLDLQSHGLQLNDKTDEWEVTLLPVEKSSVEKLLEIFKYPFALVPIVPDLVSLIKDSVECDAGKKDSCKDVAIDAVSLGIDIIPGSKLLKGPAKSLTGVLTGISRAKKDVSLAKILASLKKRHLGKLGDWFKRHPDTVDKMKRSRIQFCEYRFKTGKKLKNTERFIRGLIRTFQGKDKRGKQDKEQVKKGTAPPEVELDLRSLTKADYKSFIQKMRELYRNDAGGAKQIHAKFVLPDQGNPGGKAVTLSFRTEDLYLTGIRKDSEPWITLKEKEVRYSDKTKPLNVNRAVMGQNFLELYNNPRAIVRGEHLSESARRIVGFTAEAIRFGNVRKAFTEILRDKGRGGRSPTKHFDLANFAETLDSWAKQSKDLRESGRFSGSKKLVGIADDKAGGLDSIDIYDLSGPCKFEGESSRSVGKRKM